MVLSEKAMRAWKLGTAISTTFVAWYALFEVDYMNSDHIEAYRRKYGEEDPHVLASLQKYFRRTRDRWMLGVDIPPPTSNSEQVQPQKTERNEPFERPTR